MDGILPRGPERVKRSTSKRLRETRDAGVHRLCLIILNLIHGRGVALTARVVGVAQSAVRRVVHRFMDLGEAGGQSAGAVCVFDLGGPCPGDVDGEIGVIDFLALLARWG